MTKINTLHLVSINAQGLRDRAKRARLKQWIVQQKADIVFLQESHFTPDLMSTITTDFDEWNVFCSFGTNNSRGCSIMLHNSIEMCVLNKKIDDNGRYIILNIEVYDTR